MTSTSQSAVVAAKSSTIESLLAQAAERGQKVLLDFHAPWCGPCQAMHPVIERFAQEHPDVAVVTVDIDDCTQFAVKNAVRSVPTFMVVEGGVTLRSARGAQSYDNLKKLVTG